MAESVVRFEVNEAFSPHLTQAVIKAMDDLREETYQEVKRGITPTTIVSNVAVNTTVARPDGGDVTASVGYGRGLGPIFEGGTGARFTKGLGKKQKYPPGVHRGRISTANHAISNARESARRRGLDLSRYL